MKSSNKMSPKPWGKLVNRNGFKMTEIMELADQDIKTATVNMYKYIKENIIMLRREIKKNQWKF